MMNFILLSILLYAGCYNCASINDTQVLLQDLLIRYNKNVRPVANQDDAVHVNVSLYVMSIQELDEIRGIFSVMGIFSITWQDANMIWNQEKYGNISYVFTSYSDVWVPEIILSNPAEESDTLGKMWQRVRFQSDGYAFWWPGGLMKTTCILSMNKYPFDSHECYLAFSALGYFRGEVKLTPGTAGVSLLYYTGNNAWEIVKTETKPINEGMFFYFYLERKPGFVVVNVLLPLTFLSLLNVFAFLLSPESGERISYCITVLLSIAVFMTIVSDTLPQSSDPVPVISYKLVFDMVISSFMTVITILNFRLYHRSPTETVPAWLQNIYLFLKFKCSIQPLVETTNNLLERKQPVHENANLHLRLKGPKVMCKSILDNSKHNITDPTINVSNLEDISDEIIEQQLTRKNDESQAKTRVTWKNISNMVDGIAFSVFSLLSVGSFVVFMFLTY